MATVHSVGGSAPRRRALADPRDMRLDCGDWWTPDGDEDPRIVTVRDARRLGYTRSAIEHRVRTGRWRRVLPRTYLTAGTLIWPDRQRAALAFAGAGALLTGAAALADAELRCVRPPDQVLVLVPAARRVRSTGFVRIRATNRMPERALLPGPARVPLGRAVADLALEKRRLDDVRALVGESVRKRLCTVDELVAELESGPRNGSAHLRDAVEEIARGAWSAPRRVPLPSCAGRACRDSSRTCGSSCPADAIT